jgi:G3E family GTPase
MEKKDVPVLLLTGYLGSGKTTLVNHILTNRKGIRFAVIVNDLGEVNIDASLIQKGGVVDQKDDSLVALQNGCICCTLKTDLIDQIFELMKSEKFDYIVIEASGICEPEPIAQTVCSIPTFGEAYRKYGICRLDCIVTVVDALRFQSEFACGDSLTKADIAEDDIENLIIQQVEFCNKILLNKASEVTPEELGRIRQIIKTIQPGAEIIECDYANIDLDQILNTRMFDFEKVATSAGWIRGIEGPVEEEEHHHHHDHEHEDEHAHHHDHHDHECGHHHHHHHDEGEAEEYGISTFVYYRRRAFDINKFDYFVAKHWPKSVIRAKGVCYFSDNRDMSYLFEQAGKQKSIKEAGLWYATAPADELAELMKQEPGLMRDWDPEYGDRMQKIVFIGQKMDKEQIIKLLDDCLE